MVTSPAVLPAWPVGWWCLVGAGGFQRLRRCRTAEPGTAEGADVGPFTQAARGDHDRPVWSLAFAPGDAYLAAATIAGDVWIKDLSTEHSRRLMEGPYGSSKELAFSPDGRTLAVMSGGAAGWQWAVDTGTELEPLTVGGADAISDIAVSPDGVLMAMGVSRYGHPRQVLTLVDRAHGRSYVLDGHPVGVNVMAFSPDGRTLATGDTTGLVKLWNVATLRPRATLRGINPGAQSLVFSPDGSRLATLVDLGHVIQFWDTATGESRGEISVAVSAASAFAFSPDGKTMAVAGADGVATLWDVVEARKLGSFGGRGRSLYAVAFSSDGRRIATGGAEGNVCLWEVSRIDIETRLRRSRHGQRLTWEATNP